MYIQKLFIYFRLSSIALFRSTKRLPFILYIFTLHFILYFFFLYFISLNKKIIFFFNNIQNMKTKLFEKFDKKV